MNTRTTRVIEYGGSNIEAAQIGTEWYVTIDGVELTGSWPRAMLALDAAKRKVTLRNRRAARRKPKARVAAVDWLESMRRDHELRGYVWAARFEAEFGWWPGCVGPKPDNLDAIISRETQA